MKTSYWVAGLAILAVAVMLLPSIVVAQHGGQNGPPKEFHSGMKGHGGSSSPHVEWMSEALELTEEQQDKTDALRLEHQQKQLRLKGKISGAEAELKALLLDPEATRSAVLAAGQAVQQLRNQSTTQKLEHRMDFREILTAEQRAELVKMGLRGRGARGLHRMHGQHGMRPLHEMPGRGEDL